MLSTTLTGGLLMLFILQPTGGTVTIKPPRIRVTRTSNTSPLNLRNNLSSSDFQTTFNKTVFTNSTTSTKSTPRNREQYLLNVFEVIVSTLETKLQRIENLDKAMEHVMRRVEALDMRLSYNIDKTDSVIVKLRNLDTKLFHSMPKMLSNAAKHTIVYPTNDVAAIDSKLLSLDQKVTEIDSKLEKLKTQIDSNVVSEDAFNAEPSERRFAIDSSKLFGTQLELIRGIASNIERKISHQSTTINQSVNKLAEMVVDIHQAVVDHHPYYTNETTTTSAPKPPLSSKFDRLVEKMHPILGVSEKMDEVWNVVVGTKTSVDDLVPKSDELLTQTQRQERAIYDIHADLRQNTNQIIENLGIVERRLKKQEDDVVQLAQRPVPAELLLDPTIDRLVEFDQSRYNSVHDDYVPPGAASFTESPSAHQASSTAPPQPNSPTLVLPVGQNAVPSSFIKATKNRGVIFPSVKNKPSPTNSSSANDVENNLRDIKGYSCSDLLEAGMRQSGIYYLQIRGTTYWYLKVYCEQEIADGGWTVIQRRDDFGEARENFNRDWIDYKNGFGDPSREFWLGNENIYMLTNNEEYMLRIELEDFEGNKRFAQYSHFKLYSESEYYKLEIDGYQGNAGDSLNDPWYGSNSSPFSTYNRDNDRSSLNCASMLKGGWWWKSCGRGLNGLYLHDPQDLTARQGIVWFRWRGWDYTLKKASMMIKPKTQR